MGLGDAVVAVPAPIVISRDPEGVERHLKAVVLVDFARRGVTARAAGAVAEPPELEGVARVDPDIAVATFPLGRPEALRKLVRRLGETRGSELSCLGPSLFDVSKSGERRL